MRPLAAVSNDVSDPPPITPADFLMTGSRFLGGLPETEFASYSLKTRKEMMGRVTKELWIELVSNYILELQKSRGVRGEHRLKVGDFVLLLDKQLPSGKYCMGRIESEVKNPDGQARSFMIRHQGRLVCRSIMTLAPLELALDEDKKTSLDGKAAPDTKEVPSGSSAPSGERQEVAPLASSPPNQVALRDDATLTEQRPRRESADDAVP